MKKIRRAGSARIACGVSTARESLAHEPTEANEEDSPFGAVGSDRRCRHGDHLPAKRPLDPGTIVLVPSAHLDHIPPALAVLALVVACLAVHHPLVYSNWTKSMPEGLYLRAREPLTPGTLVLVPSANLDHCGLEVPPLLLKKIAYTAGTRIIVNKTGLFADGKLVAPRVAPIGINYSGILTANQVVVLGESPRSFDSRYFGPVSTAGLRPVIPLVTW